MGVSLLLGQIRKMEISFKGINMTNDTLKEGEPHPIAQEALSYLSSLGIEELWKWQEAFCSCAIENNRLGEICAGTMDRLLKKEPVSDRYLLGLAFTILHSKMKEKEKK